MKKTISLLLLTLVISLSGCGNADEKAARKMMGEGLKMEKDSVVDAAMLYEQIVQKYPETATALEAKRRSDELKKQYKEHVQKMMNGVNR